MIGIKDMDMPCKCWECGFISESTSGMTICFLTGEALYPVGTKETREYDCPLVEIPDTEDIGSNVI